MELGLRQRTSSIDGHCLQQKLWWSVAKEFSEPTGGVEITVDWMATWKFGHAGSEGSLQRRGRETRGWVGSDGIGERASANCLIWLGRRKLVERA